MSDAPTPQLVAVDLIVVDHFAERPAKILLIKRLNDPFKDHYALPGGFVDPGETVEAAARRELKEETGLDPASGLSLLGVYSEPDRDPRGRVISVAYIVRVFASEAAGVKAGDDAKSLDWVSVDDAIRAGLAFDHDRILLDALRRL